ncbi:Uncharacterised protein [Mycobacteroides abscessus subsp. abscessus]|nr:Uncharacterised protein [Mycobacteroides abscessus subsp. abscessus]
MVTLRALTTGNDMPASGTRVARSAATGAVSVMDSCLRASCTVAAVVHT